MENIDRFGPPFIGFREAIQFEDRARVTSLFDSGCDEPPESLWNGSDTICRDRRAGDSHWPTLEAGRCSHVRLWVFDAVWEKPFSEDVAPRLFRFQCRDSCSTSFM